MPSLTNILVDLRSSLAHLYVDWVINIIIIRAIFASMVYQFYIPVMAVAPLHSTIMHHLLGTSGITWNRTIQRLLCQVWTGISFLALLVSASILCVAMTREKSLGNVFPLHSLYHTLEVLLWLDRSRVMYSASSHIERQPSYSAIWYLCW